MTTTPRDIYQRQLADLTKVVERLNTIMRQRQPPYALIDMRWARFYNGWQNHLRAPRSVQLPYIVMNSLVAYWINALAQLGIIPGFDMVGDSADPLLWTPGAISAEVAKVKTFIDGLNTEVTRQGGARIDPSKEPNPTDKRKALAGFAYGVWAPFFGEWSKWHQSLNWTSGLTGATVATARRYQAQASELMDRFRSIGGDTQYAPSKPPTTRDPTEQLIRAALWLAGIYGAVKLIPPFLTVLRGKV